MCFQDLCLNIRTVFAFGDRTKIHLVRPDWSLVSSPGAKLTKKYLQIISNIFCTTRCCRNCFCVLEFCLTHIMSGMMKLTNPRKIAFVNREMMTEVTNHYHPQADTICINLKSICLLGGGQPQGICFSLRIVDKHNKGHNMFKCMCIYILYIHMCV